MSTHDDVPPGSADYPAPLARIRSLVQAAPPSAPLRPAHADRRRRRACRRARRSRPAARCADPSQSTPRAATRRPPRRHRGRREPGRRRRPAAARAPESRRLGDRRGGVANQVTAAPAVRSASVTNQAYSGSRSTSTTEAAMAFTGRRSGRRCSPRRPPTDRPAQSAHPRPPGTPRHPGSRGARTGSASRRMPGISRSWLAMARSRWSRGETDWRPMAREDSSHVENLSRGGARRSSHATLPAIATPLPRLPAPQHGVFRGRWFTWRVRKSSQRSGILPAGGGRWRRAGRRHRARVVQSRDGGRSTLMSRFLYDPGRGPTPATPRPTRWRPRWTLASADAGSHVHLLHVVPSAMPPVWTDEPPMLELRTVEQAWTDGALQQLGASGRPSSALFRAA